MILKILNKKEENLQTSIAYFNNLSEFYQYINESEVDELNILFYYVDLVYIKDNIYLKCSIDERDNYICEYNVKERYNFTYKEDDPRKCLRITFLKIESILLGEEKLYNDIKFFDSASWVALFIIAIIIAIFSIIYL